MIRGRALLLLALGAPVLLAFGALGARAEVSVDRPVQGVVRAHFEPGARGPWQRVRADVLPTDLLNEHGDLNGDAWPVVQDNAGTGLPNVVWASVGDDADILFARHDGAGWSPALRLSEPHGADRLPALDSDDKGNRFVAWDRHRNTRHAVHFAAVAGDDSGRTSVVELSSRPRQGRLPSVIVDADGGVYVAYEEATSASDPTIAVAIDRIDVPRRSDGIVQCSGEIPIDVARVATFVTHLQGSSAVADVMLDDESGSIRVTWADSASETGASYLVDGMFTAPGYALR